MNKVIDKVIECPCGYVVRARSEQELIARAQDHAEKVHQMQLTRDQALAMARPA